MSTTYILFRPVGTACNATAPCPPAAVGSKEYEVFVKKACPGRLVNFAKPFAPEKMRRVRSRGALSHITRSTSGVDLSLIKTYGKGMARRPCLPPPLVPALLQQRAARCRGRAGLQGACASERLPECMRNAWGVAGLIAGLIARRAPARCQQSG